jgi:uncharacterized membrane protein
MLGGLVPAGNGIAAVVAMAVGDKKTGDGVDGWHAVSPTTHAAISKPKRERISNRAI